MTPNIVLSNPVALRLPLRWLAILYGRVDCDLAATSGIHSADDVIKSLLTGAKAAMMASALLKDGPHRLTEARDGLRDWLTERDYVSADQARGSLSYSSVPDPGVFERTSYVRTLTSYTPTW